jgi:hypothetical protein
MKQQESVNGSTITRWLNLILLITLSISTLFISIPTASASKYNGDSLISSIPVNATTATEFELSISTSDHDKYGFTYPATYMFSLPPSSSNLHAYRQPSGSGNWAAIQEKTSSDLFSGIEAVRFDYNQSIAYISIAFPEQSDSQCIKITDQNGDNVPITYLGIPDYYDNRKATVSVTIDDIGCDQPWGGNSEFLLASQVFAQAQVWWTGGILTQGSQKDWSVYQTGVNNGFYEVASHSRKHQDPPYTDYDSEIGGSKTDLISNLTLPYSRGTTGFIWCWISPSGGWDDTISQKLGQYNYLIPRYSSELNAPVPWSNWDYTNNHFDQTWNSTYLDIQTLEHMNSVFNQTYAAGGFYMTWGHIGKHTWTPGSIAYEHIQYIKGKHDIWYAGLGQIYMYRYTQMVVSVYPFTSANHSPVLNPIGDKTGNIGQSLSFTISATDIDNDTLTYSVSNLPSGASFDTSTGVFNWTPTLGAVYNVVFGVSDGKSGQVTEAISITINPVNHPPVLAPIGNKTVTAGQLLNFTVTATDADQDTLTYSVTNLPSGANFNTSTGVFNWTSPVAGTYYNIVFGVTDGKLEPVTRTIWINVNAANHSPVLNSIGNKTSSVGQPLSFTVTATDADQDTLTYSVTNLPSGANFNTSTGVFNWTPDNANVYSNVTFGVTDGKSTPVTETINITINAVNHPPVLGPIGNKTGSVGQPLSFTITASDADHDTLTYSASNLPGGVSFNTSTGVFNWTPDSASVYSNVSFGITDGKSAPVTETITITINAVNHPPVLSSIGNKTVNVGQLLSFTITATDADQDALTYSVTNLPNGANFDTSTGVFNWTPDNADVYSNITFSVTDGKSTPVTETITITTISIVVNNAPVISGGFSGSYSGGESSGAASGPGVTSLIPYTSYDGHFNLVAVVKSDDNRVNLTIDKGVLASSKDSYPLKSIKIVPIDSPLSAPEGYQIIGSTYDCTPEGSIFSPAIHLTFSYDPSILPANISPNNLSLAVYNPSTSAWEIIPSIASATDSNVTASTEHFSIYTILGKETTPVAPTTLPAPAPASFTISNISVTPDLCLPDESVTVSSLVGNIGGIEGNYTVTLKLNGSTVETKQILLSPGENKTVDFSIKQQVVGNYTVDVNGLSSIFTVSQPQSTSTSVVNQQTPIPGTSGKGDLNGTIILIVVGGIVIITMIIAFASTRKKKQQ